MIRAFNLKKFLSSVAYPVGGGVLSAILTSGAMKSYADMSKPPLSTPGWVFPVVWTILYILMGISLYIIRESAISRCQKNDAILKFVIQLKYARAIRFRNRSKRNHTAFVGLGRNPSQCNS